MYKLVNCIFFAPKKNHNFFLLNIKKNKIYKIPFNFYEEINLINKLNDKEFYQISKAFKAFLSKEGLLLYEPK